MGQSNCTRSALATTIVQEQRGSRSSNDLQNPLLEIFALLYLGYAHIFYPSL